MYIVEYVLSFVLGSSILSSVENPLVCFSTEQVGLVVSPVPFPKSIIGYNSSFPVKTQSFSDSDPAVNFHLQKLFQDSKDGNALIHDEIILQESSNHSIEDLDIQYDASVKLESGIDESYSLLVSLERITIRAPTNWGAINGLKTLSQLIYCQGLACKVQQVTINDKPQYSHRGVMVDSSRNFLSTESIKQQLQLMSMTKLNVLHWHFQDSQSWPLLLNELDIVDPYSDEEVYTQADIKSIIEFAYYRGIRIIPELDLPGHSNAGYRKLDSNLIICDSPSHDWQLNSVEPPSGQLNLVYSKTYDIIQKIYQDLELIFPGDSIHLGHDEVNQNCYQNHPPTKEWLQLRNATVVDLISHWIDKLLSMINSTTDTNEKTLIMWEDVVTAYNLSISKNIVLQNWLGSANIKHLTSQGYKVIVSSSEYYYLDCGFGQWLINSTGVSWCDPYKHWQVLYRYDFTQNLTDTEAANILGGEVALWGELVDSNNLISKIWPRSIAFAERLWYGNDDFMNFTKRIFRFREYLNQLGWHLGPLGPKYCAKDPTLCML